MVQRGIWGKQNRLIFFLGSLSSRNIYSFWTKPVNLWSGLHGFILRVELSLNFENCGVNKNHGCFKNHTATYAYNLISPSAKIGWFQILKQLWQQPFMWSLPPLATHVFLPVPCLSSQSLPPSPCWPQGSHREAYPPAAHLGAAVHLNLPVSWGWISHSLSNLFYGIHNLELTIFVHVKYQLSGKIAHGLSKIPWFRGGFLWWICSF